MSENLLAVLPHHWTALQTQVATGAKQTFFMHSEYDLQNWMLLSPTLQFQGGQLND